MMGRDIGQLNIYIKSGLTIGKMVFNETGDQGKFWMHGRATVSSSSPFKVLCVCVCVCVFVFVFVFVFVRVRVRVRASL